MTAKTKSTSLFRLSNKDEYEEQKLQEYKETLIGYKILHHTLEKESQLKYLHWLRYVTFRGPEDETKEIMTTIYNTSKKRMIELERLWKIPYDPIIQIENTPISLIGDSIQADVEYSSTIEMLSISISMPSSSSSSSTTKSPWKIWDIRFFLIQAQATRMVSGVATSIRKFERNDERRKWLIELAEEYENIREDLVFLLSGVSTS
ncbi:hypothetical protein FRACYDRAFT_233200 [Fragilariopsis cylindrus CCMP1102]|uniref:Uncharacterized protein n=1 Tax=Fragilariopsis cylindrus CCMP1102 TaxID=635003 RepID=A0A1E7FZ02_9STRA|nr:hypothetical protein FRACYDRAFT_233200 [Fragilariopsis cylindrus CCMP1102]|eukprot:OEU23033.1 hypothetical protein FRACYDRAFT_233200 [Fragilariopsis cylindrus CCMP1102]